MFKQKKLANVPAWVLSGLVVLAALAAGRTEAVGTWTPLVNNPGTGINNMLLLPDGTVLAHGSGSNRSWYKLTPNSTGSYINGTWSTLASMKYQRLYYSSQVLTNGQVFVAGAEYSPNEFEGPGSVSGEIYNPLANTWTLLPNPPQYNAFYDSESKLLPNGNVIVSPVSPAFNGETLIWSTAANAWSTGPILYRGHNQDEASWVELPDQSILTIDPYGQNSERYIPSLNAWINDSSVPVPMYSNIEELGPGVLLPNGDAFFIGGTNHTAIYSPTGTTNAGTWTAGPNIPNNYGVQDGPAAMMVNGNVLCCLGTNANSFGSVCYFYEYNYLANSFTAAPSPTSTTPGASFNNVEYSCSMLDLPDGTVLLSYDNRQLYVYTPDGSPLAAGQPAINGITLNPGGSFQLTGTLLNGICEGAAYGDDEQMNTDYPLVRMTNSATGNVIYARTYNWNNTTIMTGTNVVATQFAVPTTAPSGTYSLVVTANGNSSAPVTLNYALQLSGPTNQVASVGSNVTFAVTTFGTGPFTYQWQLNGTNLSSAQGSTLTLDDVTSGNAGNYQVIAANAYGTVTSIVVTLTVAVAPLIVTDLPPQVTLIAGQAYTYSVRAMGAVPLHYQWYNGAVPISGQTGLTYAPSTSIAGSFLYSVVVTNSFGSVTSTVSTLSIPSCTTNAYFAAITGLHPVGYWPMHEVEAPAPGDIETNYGTLGLLGSGFYSDWAENSGGFLHQFMGALAGDSDSSVFFTTPLSNSSGDTNSLYIPHLSPLSTLNPPFSVECWVFPTTTGSQGDVWSQSGYEGLNAGNEGSGNNQVCGVRLYWSSPGFTIYSYDNASTLESPISISTGIVTNNWYHVVLTCDIATNMTLYTNGVAAASASAVGKYSPDYWTPFEIGNGRGNTRAFPRGAVDELAIYTNVLSAAAIASHYAAGTNRNPEPSYFQLVEISNPAVYLRMDSPAYIVPPENTWPALFNFGSAGANGFYTPGTMPGILPGPVNTNGALFRGLSGVNVPLLSGVGSYGDAGYASAYDPVGAVPFSITAMFRGNPVDGRFQNIVGHSDDSWRIAMNSNGHLQCTLGSDTNSIINSAGLYNDGNWHQLVEVYSPASASGVTGTNLLYVDGVLDTTVTNLITSGIGPGSPTDVMLGADPEYTCKPAGLGRQFAGEVCEVALFQSALTAAQVQALYQVALPPVNTTPTNIVFSIVNNQLSLSWPVDHTGWMLQAQTNSLAVGLSTNWVNITGSTATNVIAIPINLTNGSVFYRLVLMQ